MRKKRPKWLRLVRPDCLRAIPGGLLPAGESRALREGGFTIEREKKSDDITKRDKVFSETFI